MLIENKTNITTEHSVQRSADGVGYLARRFTPGSTNNEYYN